MVIIVAVHEMDQLYILRMWTKNSKRGYRVKSWEKTGEYTKNLDQYTKNLLFMMSFNMELNPLTTLPGMQTDLYPTFYFLVFRPTPCICMLFMLI